MFFNIKFNYKNLLISYNFIKINYFALHSCIKGIFFNWEMGQYIFSYLKLVLINWYQMNLYKIFSLFINKLIKFSKSYRKLMGCIQ